MVILASCDHGYELYVEPETCKIFQSESKMIKHWEFDRNIDNFFLSDSPKSTNKTANLTGNERQVKDGCADIYNAVQKWSKINREGTDVITEMANIRISFL